MRGRGAAPRARGRARGRGGGQLRIPNLVPRYELNNRVLFRTEVGLPVRHGEIYSVETRSSVATGRKMIKYGISEYDPVTMQVIHNHRPLHEHLIVGLVP